LYAGTHTISLQSCVVSIDYVPRLFYPAYRLSRIGSELFEALHPDARSLLLHARDPRFVRRRSGAKKIEVRNLFKAGHHVIPDAQYARLGDQLSSLIGGMRVPNLMIGVKHLEKSTATFSGEGDDYCMTFEGTYDQAFAMSREEGGHGPIRIDTPPALIDSLLQVVTGIDRKVIRKILAATQQEEEFNRGEDGKLHMVHRPL
jgi:hypothetical protein